LVGECGPTLPQRDVRSLRLLRLGELQPDLIGLGGTVEIALCAQVVADPFMRQEELPMQVFVGTIVGSELRKRGLPDASVL